MQTSEPDSNPVNTVNLTLVADPAVARSFRPLMEQGFSVRIEEGGSVQDVLCRQLGVPEDYLRDRVQTVFLNGKAVDDETTAEVAGGDRLALSASMPGLAGATLRKGGFFSGFRSAISHKSREQSPTGKKRAAISVKLFNMIAAEIAPLFLQRGIEINGTQLADLFAGLEEEFWQRIEAAEIDGRPCDLPQLKTTGWIAERVHLTLRSN